MKRVNLENGLDLVEKILIEKIKIYKKEKQLTALVSYNNALNMIRLARNGNIESLNKQLAEYKEIQKNIDK